MFTSCPGTQTCAQVIARDGIAAVRTNRCREEWVQLLREFWEVFPEENPVRCPVCFAGSSLESNKKIVYQTQDTAQMYYIIMMFWKNLVVRPTAAFFLNPCCVYQIPNLSFALAFLNIYEETDSPEVPIASCWVFCAYFLWDTGNREDNVLCPFRWPSAL